MIVKLLTEHHLEFLSLKGGCKGSSESFVKMPHCWKSHALAQFSLLFLISNKIFVIRTDIHKTLVRIANREDPDKTASLEVV